MAFDPLAIGGVDLRTQRWTVRRARLEALASQWRPPLQLTPVTYDLAEAQEWFEVLPKAIGTEGLVIKPTSSRYVGGRRSDWSKIKHRATREIIIGGVIGPIDKPEVLVAGLYRDSDLVVVGRTTALTAAQSADVAAVLRPAKARHPWPDEISSHRWAGQDSKKPLTKVNPVTVAEVTADPALQAGQARHPLRFVRIRADLTPDDLETLTP
jgi:ATP-dependent DNA ligase